MSYKGKKDERENWSSLEALLSSLEALFSLFQQNELAEKTPEKYKKEDNRRGGKEGRETNRLI